jgi:hypothetical protein
MNLPQGTLQQNGEKSGKKGELRGDADLKSVPEIFDLLKD